MEALSISFPSQWIVGPLVRLQTHTQELLSMETVHESEIIFVFVVFKSGKDEQI